VRGPLGVYYYDHLAEALGPNAKTATALTEREHGDVLAFEALNLVNGKRTVSEIRDVLAGRYEPVPPAEVSEYVDLLAKARRSPTAEAGSRAYGLAGVAAPV